MQPGERKRILRVLRAMQDDPFHGDVEHLTNAPVAFRRRSGDWRILFDPDPDRHIIVVTAILRRTSKTYRR